jgi:hypothetical protein
MEHGEFTTKLTRQKQRKMKFAPEVTSAQQLQRSKAFRILHCGRIQNVGMVLLIDVDE